MSVFQHVHCTDNMRLALGPLCSLSYGRDCLSEEIIIVYVATQMHILPEGKCREEEACAATQVPLWKLHKKPLHAIVTSFGLNESSLCVSYLKGKRKEEMHSPPSGLLLLALQLCLKEFEYSW